MIMSQWHYYLLSQSTQWNTFNDVCLLSKFNVSNFSVTGDIDFQTGHVADFEQFKVENYFADLELVKIDSISSLLLTIGSSVFPEFGQDMPQKTILKKSRTIHNIWHKLLSVIQSAGIKNWFPQSINRLQRFRLQFLPVSSFSFGRPWKPS